MYTHSAEFMTSSMSVLCFFSESKAKNAGRHGQPGSANYQGNVLAAEEARISHMYNMRHQIKYIRQINLYLYVYMCISYMHICC